MEKGERDGGERRKDVQVVSLQAGGGRVKRGVGRGEEAGRRGGAGRDNLPGVDMTGGGLVVPMACPWRGWGRGIRFSKFSEFLNI